MTPDKVADHVVDACAVVALAALAWAPGGNTAALAAAISSVAVGKRWLRGGA